MYWKTFAAALLLLLATHTSQFSPEQYEAIDKVVEEFIASYDLASLTLSIVDDQDGSTLAKGYGFRDIQQQLPAENKTLYVVGSISKGITATLVVRVLSEKFPLLGESVLDTPIIELAPELNFTFIDRYRHESMSFRDLLAHRTCLGDNSAIPVLFGAFNGSVEETMYRSRYYEETCRFRNGFAYNNAFISLAGNLAAQIAGTTYPELLQRLADDLGMPDTTVLTRSTEESSLSMAGAYYYRNEEPRKIDFEVLKNAEIINPAGGVLCSSRDMLKYLEFHMNYGKVNGVQIMPQAVMKWFHINSNGFKTITYKANEDDFVEADFGYGLGLILGTYDGWQVSVHGGALQPYTSRLSIYFPKKLAIFTAANGPGSALQAFIGQPHLHRAIYNVLRGARSVSPASLKHNLKLDGNVNWPAEQLQLQPPVPISRSEIKPLRNSVPLKQEDLVGTFGNAAMGDVEITMSGTRLQFHYGRWLLATMTLVDEAENVFMLDFDSPELESLLLVFLGGTVESVHQLLYMQFVDADTLWFYIPFYSFRRDEILETFPGLPWAPESCAP